VLSRKFVRSSRNSRMVAGLARACTRRFLGGLPTNSHQPNGHFRQKKVCKEKLAELMAALTINGGKPGVFEQMNTPK
jgi:hypothetical protein